jgi:TolB-like protein
MKTKKNLTILLFAILTMIAGAADKSQPALTVAVYDFKGGADAASFGDKVTTLVTANLTTETNLVMVERAELTKALNEQAFGISGMVSSDAAARIGEITGAKVLVAGQVIKTGDNHLVIVADIIGTETGRLFADKVEGASDSLMDLTSQLSRKIAQTINDQATNLIAAAQESSAERLDRIIKNINSTNRPSVSVDINWFDRKKRTHQSTVAEGEFGTVLLKAGFAVVDSNSDRKPDVEITGTESSSPGPRQGVLFSFSDAMDLKIQERRTGNIIAIEHQIGSASDGARATANAAAQVNAVDALAERILPLLAK